VDRFSPGTSRLLERLNGDANGAPLTAIAPFGFRLVKVEGPAEDIEALVVDAYASDKQIRRASRRLARTNRPQAGMDKEGRFTLDGRACCWTHSQQIVARAAILPVGSEHQCPGCGTFWRLETGAQS
jgi:hypothetical protein